MWNPYKKRKTFLILGLVLLAGILWLRGVHIQSVPEYQKEQEEIARELGVVSQMPQEPALTGKSVGEGSREISEAEGQNRKTGKNSEKGKESAETETAGTDSAEDSRHSSGDPAGSRKTAAKNTKESKQASGKSPERNSAGIGSEDAEGSSGEEQPNSFSTGGQEAGSEPSEDRNGGEAQEEANPSSAPKPDAVRKISCSLEIRCDKLVENKNKIDSNYWKYIPPDGEILKKTTVSVDQGISAYELLSKVCQAQNIAIDASYTPMYKSYYVSGIAHLYEKQAGTMSGWIYKVNGKSPNRGASAFTLSDGDACTWYYTCDGKTS